MLSNHLRSQRRLKRHIPPQHLFVLIIPTGATIWTQAQKAILRVRFPPGPFPMIGTIKRLIAFAVLGGKRHADRDFATLALHPGFLARMKSVARYGLRNLHPPPVHCASSNPICLANYIRPQMIARRYLIPAMRRRGSGSAASTSRFGRR